MSSVTFSISGLTPTVVGSGVSLALTGKYPVVPFNNPVTGDPQEYFKSGMLTKDGLGVVTYAVDLLGMGGYGTPADMTISIQNTELLSEYLRVHGITLRGKTVRFYVVENGVFILQATWVISHDSYDEGAITLSAEDATKRIHKTSPKEVVTSVRYPEAPSSSQGVVIPHNIGYVPRAKLIQLTGAVSYLTIPGPPERYSCKVVSRGMGNPGIAQTGVPTAHILNNWLTMWVDLDIPGVTLGLNALVGRYLTLNIGNSQTVKLITYSEASTGAFIGPFGFLNKVRVYFSGCFLQSDGTLAQPSLGQWWAMVYTATDVRVLSSKYVLSFGPEVFYYSSEAGRYFTATGVVVKSLLGNTAESYYKPGVLLDRSLSELSLPVTDLIPVQYITGSLSVSVPVAVGASPATGLPLLPGESGDWNLTIDRLKATKRTSRYQFFSSAVATGYAVTATTSVDLPFDQTLSERYASVYPLFNMSVEHSTANSGHVTSFKVAVALSIIAVDGTVIPLAGTTGNETEIIAGDGYAPTKTTVSGRYVTTLNIESIPAKWLTDSAAGYMPSFQKSMTDAFSTFWDGIAAIKDKAMINRLRASVIVRFNAQKSDGIANADTAKFEVAEVALISMSEVDNQNLYVKTVGETYGVKWLGRRNINAPVLGVVDAVEHVIRELDGSPELVDTASFDEAALVRHTPNWPIGIHLNSQVNNADLINDLCEHALAVIVPTPDGKRAIKCWYEYKGGEDTELNESMYDTASLSKMVDTPISKCFTEIELKYAYDFATNRFLKTLIVSNTSQATFPDESDTDPITGSPIWKDWVQGVPFYTTALDLWTLGRENYLLLGNANKLTKELKYFIDLSEFDILDGYNPVYALASMLLGKVGRPKKTVSLSIPITSVHLTKFYIANAVRFRDQKLTAGSALWAWVSSWSINTRTDMLDLELLVWTYEIADAPPDSLLLNNDEPLLLNNNEPLLLG